MGRNIVLLILYLAGLSISHLAQSAIENQPDKTQHNLHYHLTPNYPSSIQRDGIKIIASPYHKKRLLYWLDEIAQTDKGRQTLLNIILSGHELTIKNTPIASLSAGRTIAPMTEDLINGKGASVTIIFDADMPERGTHQVYDKDINLIEFNAVQNLYHELAHAMHQMNGTWRYFASEKQAIEEENIFRSQLAQLKGKKAILRYGKSGERIKSHQNKFINTHLQK